MSLLQNNYRERLIEKLKQQVHINGKDSPAAEELARLLQSDGGVPVENVEKTEAETPKKKKE